MDQHIHVAVLLCMFFINSVSSQVVYIRWDNSDGWTLKNSNSSNGKIEVPGRVPGGVYSDLAKAGVIEDILYGFNDVDTRWVAYDNWTYSAVFQVTNDLLKKNRTQLVLYGVDTVAVIKINNETVGNADNMFVRYAFDIKPYIKVGENTIDVIFTSPILVANQRSAANFTKPECVPSVYHGECHANQLRKMQASFAWDWGPAFPSMGLWKRAEIEFYDYHILREVTAESYKKDGEMYLKVACYLEKLQKINDVKVTMYADLQISGKHYTKVKEIDVTNDTDDPMVPVFETVFKLRKYNLWWPNGYGKPEESIGKVTCGINAPDKSQSSKLIHTAVRTVELVQENLNTIVSNTSADYGNTFYFKVNGQPIFAKGSNWIPAHILPELGTNETLVDNLLEAAKEAHINMLRVWGGGVYESDYFYKKCDELGIMIWQDLMFACSMYPVDETFLNSVKTEVSQNILRLKHHPSVVLWAGNNENEAALIGDWYNTGPQFQKYKDEYVTLYVDTIKPIVAQLDPLRSYVVSSPSNGIESDKNGYVSENPYDSHYGDTHYYNYISDNWDPAIYPLTRFASEYGFQSIPSLHTLRTATDNESDLGFSTQFVNHRQHSPGGFGNIRQQIEKHLKIDVVNEADFEKIVYYSQITQAMAMKVETEYYRQGQADWYTMGALYWQLNDVWQAPSWSGIEYGGRWKMLHYYAKSFFSPVLVSPRLLTTGDVDIYLLNDSPVPLDNTSTQIQVDIFNWTSLNPIKTDSYPAEVNAYSAKRQNVNLNFWLQQQKDEIFLRFRIKSDSVRSSPDNYVFPVPLKRAKGLQAANIKITASKGPDNNVILLDITVDNVVLFLWLDTPFEGHFDDNGMTVTERQTQRTFHSRRTVNLEEFKESLKYLYYLH